MNFSGPTKLRSVRRAAIMITAAFVLSATGSVASAQVSRTIKIIVPFSPGGGIDVLARIIAEQVGHAQGITVVIENRPGAGTIIGTDAVSRARPDGNTLLIANNSFVITPHLHKVSYDPLTSFEPICGVASTPTVIAVEKSEPYATLEDLLKAARAKPGELTYGSAPGSVLNVGFEMLSKIANFKMTFIPFAGTAPAVSAALGGHINVAHVDYPAAAGQVQSGTLRVLAAGSRERIGELPQVPTVAESGYKDYSLDIWYALFAPAKTPQDEVSRLAAWFTDAVRVTEIKAKLAAQGIIPATTCGAQLRADLKSQYETYGRAIREANIAAE